MLDNEEKERRENREDRERERERATTEHTEEDVVVSSDKAFQDIISDKTGLCEWM